MAEITIANLRNLKLKVTNKSASILNIVQENSIDWMHRLYWKSHVGNAFEIYSKAWMHLSISQREEKQDKRIKNRRNFGISML